MSDHNLPASELFGIPIASLTLNETLDRVDTAIRNRTDLKIGVVNAAKIVNMTRDRLLLEDVLSSHLILADGAAVVWASRILGVPLPERVAGIDLMQGMLERGAPKGYRIFLLGATDHVLGRVRQRINDNYPGIVIAGFRNGYFAESEEPAVAQEIATSQPDLLLVGITSPKKERFMAKWGDQLGVCVCHGVGGSFDVMAGKVRRAPLVWQRLGLEWLYRVLQEPKRLWRRYLVTNTLFVLLVARSVMQRLPSGRRATVKE